jgi:hypothetical protein
MLNFKIYTQLDIATIIVRLIDYYRLSLVKNLDDCIITVAFNTLGDLKLSYDNNTRIIRITTLAKYTNHIIKINELIDGTLYINDKKYNNSFDKFTKELLIITENNIKIRDLIDEYRNRILNL